MAAAPRTPLLACDLDGTLHGGDLAALAIWALLKRRPWEIVRICAWAWHGRLHLKQAVAQRQLLDYARLDWIDGVIGFLREQSATGRQLVLATGAMRVPAEAVTRQLANDYGLRFDHLLCSSPAHNLIGTAKAQALATLAGENGFDYIGDSPHQDPPVFARAHTSHFVNPTQALRQRFASEASMVFEHHTSIVQRLRQRLINLLQATAR